MAGHRDSKIENSYSDEAEFEEKENGILLDPPMEALGFMVVARAPLCVLFCHGKKVPSWSLRELL
jgi:hypothetical protein